MSFLRYSRDFQGVGDIFMRDPKRYLPFVGLLDTLMSADSALSKTQKEMLALYCSQLNGCHYCVDSHRSVLLALETDARRVGALSDNALHLLDDPLRAMFVFAGKLTTEPENIKAEDVEAMRSQGWSDQAIEDTICVVATFAFLNRLVDGIGIIGSAAHFQQVGAMVAQQGYTPLLNMLEQKSRQSA